MRISWVPAWLLMCVALASPTHAQDVFKKLVSPGQLTAKHSQLDLKCEACHRVMDKQAQSGLCKDCHKQVASDISAHQGFHGKFGAASAPCQTCHIDHAGREKNIVNFSPTGFNHNLTDYALKGRHASLECASCHSPSRKYRDAPAQCAACHAKSDPHKGSMGNDCASCHSDSNWKQAKFDHDKTKFPLTGAHTQLQCQSCHADRKFVSTSKECSSCHQKDDKHHGSFGAKCDSCHVTSSWKSGQFDHSRTNFPLQGKHNNVRCESCHTVTAAKGPIATDCNACHRKDDVHKGSNGNDCKGCHTVFDWKKSTFDHTKTKFPLGGRHAAIACIDCHAAPPSLKKLNIACISCHSRDDRHEGQLGTQCEQCHNDTSWKERVRFDHEFAPFALIGKHVEVKCAACHATLRFKDAPSDCIDCHRKDDRHAGSLGTKCDTCHNSSDWARWTFNHNTQTQFELNGAHANVQCAACHRDPVKPVSSQCVDCHRRDDIHRGNLGPDCGRCHLPESFRRLRLKF